MIHQASLSDFDFVYGLYMHPAVNPYLLYEQMPPGDFMPVYNNLIEAGVKYLYEEDGRTCGMFKLIPQLYRNDHIAYLGGLAIDPANTGKGAGTRMLREILEFAGGKGFLRIELSVATHNSKAIRLYENTGFQPEGVLRKFTHLKSENTFIDEVLMSYLLPG